MNSAISHLQLLVLLIFTGCTGQLQQFVDEDKPLVLSVVSNTAATPTYSVRNGTISFSITLQVDRTANYSILHGSGCSATRQPAGVAVTGSLQKNVSMTISVAILIADVSNYGSKVVVCAADTANYKSASTTLDFSSAMTYLNSLNELTGNGLVADATSAFQIFQADAVSGSPNRGTTANNNTASRPYQHAVFIDPNDGNKMKYFVADRDNHRVLIFNSLPTGNTATADVVVGQTNFINATINAGGGAVVSAQGFNEPCAVAVSNTGKMLIVDRVNNRVLIYNTIPTANGVAADFVIGQLYLTTGTANNFFDLTTGDKVLSDPVSVHIIAGKVYITDRNNNRVLVFNSIPTANGVAASFVIGQPNFSTVTTGTDYTNNSFLNHPYELTVSGTRLYLADADNHRVLVFDPLPTAATDKPIHVIGQTSPNLGSANQGGANPTDQTLNFPVSVAISGGRLAIADQLNQRVLFFSLPITANNPAATHVLGQATMTTPATTALCNAPPASATSYNCPKSLIFGTGYIWVSDQYNNRIQVMQLPF